MRLVKIKTLIKAAERGRYEKRRLRRMPVVASTAIRQDHFIRSFLIPTGYPPGESIAVYAVGKQRRQVLHALRCINAVHGNHLKFDPIPLAFEKLSNGNSALYQYDFGLQKPIGFKIHNRNKRIAFSVVHEVGHHLDASSIGTPDDWASFIDPRLDEFWNAVSSTPEYHALQEALNTRELPITTPEGEQTISLDDEGHEYVEYLLLDHEIFARAYAQWITIESQSLILSEQLNFYRAPHHLFHQGQWSDENFGPVRVALRKLLQEELKWIA